MSTKITNYDGGVVTVPQKVVRPESVEELQAILRDSAQFPSPVRAVGELSLLNSVCLIVWDDCEHVGFQENTPA